MFSKVYKINNNEYNRYNKGILFNNGLALNETSTLIFLACDGVNSMEHIVEKLAREYEVTSDEARADVQECIKALEDNSLIAEVKMGEYENCND